MRVLRSRATTDIPQNLVDAHTCLVGVREMASSTARDRGRQRRNFLTSMQPHQSGCYGGVTGRVHLHFFGPSLSGDLQRKLRKASLADAKREKGSDFMVQQEKPGLIAFGSLGQHA